MSEAYCLFENVEILDAEKLADYKARVSPVVEKFGGSYVVLGGETQVVEGDWSPRFPVMIRFPSLARAREWYQSDEYRDLKRLRHEAVRCNAVFIEGASPPSPTPAREPGRSAELRPARPEDTPVCGRIAYAAFRDIAERHGFPTDFPSPEAATGLLTELTASPGVDGFVAAQDGEILGSIFVSRRSPVGGISIVSVDPRCQNQQVGRSLMQHGMAFLAERGHERQQLVQAGYHNRSLCLYAKLGFEASCLLSNMTGKPIGKPIAGRTVRPATPADAAACDALCREVHGFDRATEVTHAIARGRAVVVESGGRITGYATEVGFAGHGVGVSVEDLKALIASASEISGPGLLVPTGNGELFRWCLANGLRVVQQMTLMDTAPSGPPLGAWWPAVLC